MAQQTNTALTVLEEELDKAKVSLDELIVDMDPGSAEDQMEMAGHQARIWAILSRIASINGDGNGVTTSSKMMDMHQTQFARLAAKVDADRHKEARDLLLAQKQTRGDLEALQ